MIFGKKSSEDTDKLKAQIVQLEAENKELIEALEFYANPIDWETGHKYRDDDDATIFTDGSSSATTIDAGRRAARVLNKIKNR